MCGIFGSINRDFSELRPDRAITSILERGPDRQAHFRDEGDRVSLGHVRLAIIDLSNKGDQPMSSSDDRYIIVFNGEIYNYMEIRRRLGKEYVWKSNSDTEVILACFIKWGVGCLDYFHGMFSLAIWDSVEKKLFAARDRLGVKPFYYSYDGINFAFASRPRVFFEYIDSFKSKLNRQAIRYYLESGYIPGDLSIYDKIKKLEPGHYLVYSKSDLTIKKYWSADKISTDQSLAYVPKKQMISELDQLVSKSIEWRMVSNVPVGAFLSGGIDSSLVTAVMSKLSETPINTFTIGFDDKNFNESHHASNVARHIGSKHFEETLKVTDLIDLIPTFFKEYDEPFYDFSAFPTMAASRLASKEVKVCLSGDGGDEAFGGYHYYGLIGKIDKFYKFPEPVRMLIGKVLNLGNRNFRMMGSAINYKSTAEAFAYIRSVMKSNSNILLEEYFQGTDSIHKLFNSTFKNLSSEISVEEVGMRLDIDHTLPNDYLVKVDLASMAFSLEAREPLLDHSIFEWAATLPLKWKINDGINKYLLRELAYTYVDRDILDRPKMGFRVPVAEWLRNELKSWAEELIADRVLVSQAGMEVEVLNKIWQQHLTTKFDHHTIIWTALVLLQFIKINSENILEY